jgi:hypothetical protein
MERKLHMACGRFHLDVTHGHLWRGEWAREPQQRLRALWSRFAYYHGHGRLLSVKSWAGRSSTWHYTGTILCRNETTG